MKLLSQYRRITLKLYVGSSLILKGQGLTVTISAKYKAHTPHRRDYQHVLSNVSHGSGSTWLHNFPSKQ